MTPDRLTEAVRGVRGLVLDVDGVIVLKGAPVPGSVEAIQALQERGIPFRVVTNFSQLHRQTLAGWFAKAGVAAGFHPAPGGGVCATSASYVWPL